MTTRFFLLFVICVALLGCSTLVGVGRDCNRNELPDHMQVTLDNSCGGNQQASLQIGQYYEELAVSKGDEQHYKKAADYYALAAASSSGQTYIYVPGAGKVAGYTMPVTTGPRTYGLAEAQYRLGLLYRDGLGVRKTIKKACKLFETAASRKHMEASAVRCGN